MTENTEPAERDDTAGVEDFDAFWDGLGKKGHPMRIMGEVVHLPAAVPLQFEMEARKASKSKSSKDVEKLVAILFGAGRLEQWTKAGMDIEQLKVLLAYAPRKIAGHNITMAECAAAVTEADADTDPT